MDDIEEEEQVIFSISSPAVNFKEIALASTNDSELLYWSSK